MTRWWPWCCCKTCWTVQEDFDGLLPSELPPDTSQGAWQAFVNPNSGGAGRTGWTTHNGQLVNEQQYFSQTFEGIFCLIPNDLPANWDYLAIQVDVFNVSADCPDGQALDDEGGTITRGRYGQWTNGGFGLFIGGIEPPQVVPSFPGPPAGKNTVRMSAYLYDTVKVPFESANQGTAISGVATPETGPSVSAFGGLLPVAFYPHPNFEGICADAHQLRVEIEKTTGNLYDVRWFHNGELRSTETGLEFDWPANTPVGLYHGDFGGRFDNLCITTCKGPGCPEPPVGPCFRCDDGESHRRILPCFAFCAELLFEVNGFTDGCGGCSALDGTYTIPETGEFGGCESPVGGMPTGIFSPCDPEDEVIAEWQITSNCSGEPTEETHFFTVQFSLKYGGCVHTWEGTIEGDDLDYACEALNAGIPLDLTVNTGSPCCTPPASITFKVRTGDCQQECGPEITATGLKVSLTTPEGTFPICLPQVDENVWSGSTSFAYPTCGTVHLLGTVSCNGLSGEWQLTLTNTDTGEEAVTELTPFSAMVALPATFSGNADNICGSDLAISGTVEELTICSPAIEADILITEFSLPGGVVHVCLSRQTGDGCNDEWTGTLQDGTACASPVEVRIACEEGEWTLFLDEEEFEFETTGDPFSGGTASGMTTTACGGVAFTMVAATCVDPEPIPCCPDLDTDAEKCCVDIPGLNVDQTFNRFLSSDQVHVTGMLGFDGEKWIGSLTLDFNCGATPDVVWENCTITCDGEGGYTFTIPEYSAGYAASASSGSCTSGLSLTFTPLLEDDFCGVPGPHGLVNMLFESP